MRTCEQVQCLIMGKVRQRRASSFTRCAHRQNRSTATKTFRPGEHLAQGWIILWRVLFWSVWVCKHFVSHLDLIPVLPGLHKREFQRKAGDLWDFRLVRNVSRLAGKRFRIAHICLQCLSCASQAQSCMRLNTVKSSLAVCGCSPGLCVGAVA